MADPPGEFGSPILSQDASSDEDENRDVKKLMKKTPNTRSSNKSKESGLRRPPLSSVGNRELRDLSKFAKNASKMDLMKDKKKVRKKNKKEDKSYDMVSSKVDNEGERDIPSEFTSEGEVFEKDDICYDAKPLQIVEAGFMKEKSFDEVAGINVGLEQSGRADLGMDIGDGRRNLNAGGFDLVRDRQDMISKVSCEKDSDSMKDMAERVYQPRFDDNNTIFDEVEFQKEKEDDRRLAEMEFNKFLSNDDHVSEFSNRSSGSEHLNMGDLKEKCPEIEEDRRINLQKPISFDRSCAEAEMAVDREKCHVNISGVPGCDLSTAKIGLKVDNDEDRLLRDRLKDDGAGARAVFLLIYVCSFFVV